MLSAALTFSSISVPGLASELLVSEDEFIEEELQEDIIEETPVTEPAPTPQQVLQPETPEPDTQITETEPPTETVNTLETTAAPLDVPEPSAEIFQCNLPNLCKLFN